MPRLLRAALAAALAAGLTSCVILPGGSDEEPSSGTSARPSSATSPDRPDPASDPRNAKFYGQKVTWKGCGDDFECTKVTVPVDWDAPGGETIQLSMIRLPASGKKLGSMLWNPGGPGAPGVEYLKQVAPTFGKAIRRAYDSVSWDTRGVGESAPITCLPDSRLDAFYAADGTPDTTAERESLVRDMKEYAAACEANTGELLEHMDTVSTVKDMDVMRTVVGDQVLSYMGASYGTYLGAVYAELFPWRVGRLVLDGAIDPSATSAEGAQGQALGFSRAVRAFVDDCLQQADCPLRGSRADAYAQLERLLSRADQTPLQTTARPLTQALMITGLVQGMYTQQLWPAVAEGLRAALRGDGSPLLELADLYLDREGDGSYGPILQALSPIACLDQPEDRDIDRIAADAEALGKKYPPFGEAIGWGSLTCSLWPIKPEGPRTTVTGKGAAPILVVGTTDDPATPYESAQALAKELDSGVLLTRKGQGHTGYGMGSRCTDQAVEAYLVEGKIPADGTTCS